MCKPCPLSSRESCLFVLLQDMCCAQESAGRDTYRSVRPQTPLQGSNPKYQDISLQRFPLADISAATLSSAWHPRQTRLGHAAACWHGWCDLGSCNHTIPVHRQGICSTAPHPRRTAKPNWVSVHPGRCSRSPSLQQPQGTKPLLTTQGRRPVIAQGMETRPVNASQTREWRISPFLPGFALCQRLQRSMSIL